MTIKHRELGAIIYGAVEGWPIETAAYGTQLAESTLRSFAEDSVAEIADGLSAADRMYSDPETLRAAADWFADNPIGGELLKLISDERNDWPALADALAAICPHAEGWEF